MKRLPPPAHPARPVETPAPIPPEAHSSIVGVSELMLSSLPPMMSGADVYMRQFYRGNPLPSRRYLPIRGL